MSEVEQPAATAASPAPARGGRIALIAAGVIALGAAGAAVWKSGQTETPAAPPAQSQQASVEQVITQLEARLKARPDDAEGWRMLGWSYFQTERFAEAATAMKRATALDPDNPEYFSMLGEALVMASKMASPNGP